MPLNILLGKAGKPVFQHIKKIGCIVLVRSCRHNFLNTHGVYTKRTKLPPPPSKTANQCPGNMGWHGRCVNDTSWTVSWKTRYRKKTTIQITSCDISCCLCQISGQNHSVLRVLRENRCFVGWTQNQIYPKVISNLGRIFLERKKCSKMCVNDMESQNGGGGEGYGAPALPWARRRSAPVSNSACWLRGLSAQNCSSTSQHCASRSWACRGSKRAAVTPWRTLWVRVTLSTETTPKWKPRPQGYKPIRLRSQGSQSLLGSPTWFFWRAFFLGWGHNFWPEFRQHDTIFSPKLWAEVVTLTLTKKKSRDKSNGPWSL